MTTIVYERLNRGSSLDVLALGNLRQLVLTRGVLPAGVPARYLVEQDRVLVHAFIGPEALPWRDGDVVTLHASAFDRVQTRGWSVSVTGRAHGTRALCDLDQGPIALWIPHGGGDLLEVAAELVEGELIGPVKQSDTIMTP